MELRNLLHGDYNLSVQGLCVQTFRILKMDK